MSLGRLWVDGAICFPILIRWIVIYLVDSTISSLWTTRNWTLIDLDTYSEQNYSATQRESNYNVGRLCLSIQQDTRVLFYYVSLIDGATRMSPSTLQQPKYWQVFVCLVLEEVSKQMRGHLSFCPNSHQLVSSDIDDKCKLTYCFRNYSMISCKTGTKCM